MNPKHLLREVVAGAALATLWALFVLHLVSGFNFSGFAGALLLAATFIFLAFVTLARGKLLVALWLTGLAWALWISGVIVIGVVKIHGHFQEVYEAVVGMMYAPAAVVLVLLTAMMLSGYLPHLFDWMSRKEDSGRSFPLGSGG